MKRIERTPAELRDLTRNAFDVPMVGDKFHEMANYWMEVRWVFPDGGILVEYWNTGKERVQEWFANTDALKAKYAYGSGTSGYWVTICARGGRDVYLDDTKITDEDAKILKEFADKLLANQKPLEREYAELLAENFWKLFMD